MRGDKTRMLQRVSYSILLFFLLVLTALSQDTETNRAVEGIWLGTLKISGVELRLVFKVRTDSSGVPEAVLDSPDQGAKNIPVETVIVNGDSVRFLVTVVRGEYAGKFNVDRQGIHGEWRQAGMTLPLDLARVEKAPEMNRPQEPKPPFPYRVEDVMFRNEEDNITLAGTLTEPKEGSRFPAVVLVTGSGPQNRNEELMGHKPFLVLADYLTRRGIAVLRYDDRGVGKSGGSMRNATSEDFSRDAEAAWRYLRTRTEIDSSRIGIAGHSEGGMIAAMVAARNPGIGFIVMMAGTGVPGEQILLRQAALILEKSGLAPEAVALNTSIQKKLFEVLRSEQDTTIARQRLRKVYLDVISSTPDTLKRQLGLSENSIDVQVRQLMSPWMRFFLFYDPAEALKQVRCPVLVINGDRDLQVPPDLNLPAIGKALRDGGNTHFRIKRFPGLNHLFQHAETGLPGEYMKIEETFSEEAMRFIADWILNEIGRKSW